MATVVPGGLLSNPMATVLEADDPSDAAMASLKSLPWAAATTVTYGGEFTDCVVALQTAYSVGEADGDPVGDVVGEADGDPVGDADGNRVGEADGDVLGDRDGDVEGVAVGDVVGVAVQLALRVIRGAKVWVQLNSIKLPSGAESAASNPCSVWGAANVPGSQLPSNHSPSRGL